MTSISCREHDDVRVGRVPRYKNYSSQVVDGEVQLVETDPVIPSLASEHSVTINAVTREPSSRLRSRMNVDAVDLASEIKKRVKSSKS